MIIVFYGTSAELIKMYGIIKSTPRNQQMLICTSQQHKGLEKLHKQLDIIPDLYLARGWKTKDVANMQQMLGLMLKVHGKFIQQYTTIRQAIRQDYETNKTKSVVLVHGDTLTTVVGAYLGRLLGLPVAHIEAGLRSGSWRSPFPEELDRRLVTKIARIHFAPNQSAVDNLKSEKARGEIVDTVYNTAKTAIERSDKFVGSNFKQLNLPKKYGLVLLHRTELIENKDDFKEILTALKDYAELGNNLVFTMHTTTKEKITAYSLEYLLESDYIHPIPKQPYFDFMAIVKGSEFVVTDGGGLQEDAFFLGIPAIIHRARTERQEGIGLNAVLSEMNVDTVRKFLDNHPDKKDFRRTADSTDPSDIVVEYLRKNSFI